ncbi:Hypothetical predicted protein [Pelobates cultripes]|uniref:Uncharacterized protein n=1 Tax=Pelobates cultripes TaxID=61616 RepID=A0AAD1ST29_PELCU|nr:Hypothetical predicted protein [Pelobates cultripes]
MRQFLAVTPDPTSQASSEAYPPSEASTPHSLSPGRDDQGETPPADWLTLLRTLPTRADLTQATTADQTSIKVDLQLMRADMQGMADRMAQIEADHDSLTAAQAAHAASHSRQTAQMHAMARYIEDLNDRGCRQNLRIRGLQEGEDTPVQLKGTLTA